MKKSIIKILIIITIIL